MYTLSGTIDSLVKLSVNLEESLTVQVDFYLAVSSLCPIPLAQSARPPRGKQVIFSTVDGDCFVHSWTGTSDALCFA